MSFLFKMRFNVLNNSQPKLNDSSAFRYSGSTTGAQQLFIYIYLIENKSYDWKKAWVIQVRLILQQTPILSC